MSFSLTGACLIGPALFYWYKTLVWIAGNKGSKLMIAGKKLLVDQLVAVPLFPAGIVALSSLGNGESLEQVKLKLETRYTTIVTRGWTFWPFWQATNFFFIPFRHQALYNNIGSYLWNTYLSYLSNKKMDSEDKESNNVVEIDDDL